MSAAGLLGSLPAPKREHIAPPPKQSVALSAVQPRVVTEPPPYGSRERRAYIPRRPSDFGDGGAFPEVGRPTSILPDLLPAPSTPCRKFADVGGDSKCITGLTSACSSGWWQIYSVVYALYAASCSTGCMVAITDFAPSAPASHTAQCTADASCIWVESMRTEPSLERVRTRKCAKFSITL